MNVYTTNFKDNKLFDLVVTDYRMPKNEGGRVIREILAMKPDQKMLLVSAYSSEALDLRKQNKLEILPKPFGGPEFMDKIRKMLNPSPRP